MLAMKTKLLSFITEQTSHYKEPVRQGTAKGEPIGLSSVKYKSSLLFLTNLKGQEIADAVDVSYGLSRVWRTEDQYLSAIEKNTRIFARSVIEYILDIMKPTKDTGPGGKACFFVIGSKINDQIAKDFADIHLYSNDLMTEIYKQAQPYMFGDFSVSHTFLSYLGFIFALRKGYDLPLIGKAVSDSSVVVKRQNGLIEFDFIEALQRPWEPDKQKAEQAKVSFLKKI
jgi:hypothetical protein